MVKFYTRSKPSTRGDASPINDGHDKLADYATGGQCAGSLDVSRDVGGIHCQNAAGGG